jgi:hypothetical protein
MLWIISLGMLEHFFSSPSSDWISLEFNRLDLVNMFSHLYLNWELDGLVFEYGTIASVWSKQIFGYREEIKIAHRLFLTACWELSLSFWNDIGEASKFNASSKAGFDWFDWHKSISDSVPGVRILNLKNTCLTEKFIFKYTRLGQRNGGSE